MTITADYGIDVSSINITGNGVGESGELLKIAGSTMVVLNNGNVGIGTINPQAKLEVAGQVKITGGSPQVGKVLVSTDSSGLAVWGYQRHTAALGSAGIIAYFENLGLFEPHTNNCDSTEAFLTLFSGSSLGFCIEKNERAAA